MNNDENDYEEIEIEPVLLAKTETEHKEVEEINDHEQLNVDTTALPVYAQKTELEIAHKNAEYLVKEISSTYDDAFALWNKVDEADSALYDYPNYKKFHEEVMKLRRKALMLEGKKEGLRPALAQAITIKDLLKRK